MILIQKNMMSYIKKTNNLIKENEGLMSEMM